LRESERERKTDGLTDGRKKETPVFYLFVETMSSDSVRRRWGRFGGCSVGVGSAARRLLKTYFISRGAKRQDFRAVEISD